jgi:hypothetical protein
MKSESRKLSLRRETLMQMNDDEMVNINGGTLSAVSRSVVKSAVQFSKWSSKECAFGAAWDTLMRSVQYSIDKAKSR